MPTNVLIAAGRVNTEQNGDNFLGPVSGFVVFDLSDQLSSIASATLRMQGLLVGEDLDETETLVVYDVSTDIDTLRSAGSPDRVIQDLRSGTEYGTVEIAQANGLAPVSIELNQAALTMLNNAQGSIAFGLYLTSTSENQNSWFAAAQTDGTVLEIGGYP